MLSADPPSPSVFSSSETESNRNQSSRCHRMEGWPPVSVVVVQGLTPSAYSRQRDQLYSSPDRQTGKSNGLDQAKSPAFSSSFASGAFRLQPRNLKCIPSPSQETLDARGKKRRADSLNEDSRVSSTVPCSNTTGSDAITFAAPATAKDSTLASPRQHADQALLFFQGLSLQSPSSARGQTSSPVSLVGSHSNRSSFLRYNNNGLASPASHAASPGSMSFMSKSPSLSPRRAPCTVLFGQSLTTSASAADKSYKLGSSPLGGASSKRPPLHGGMAHLMHSLDDQVEWRMDQGITGVKEPPMSTIHYCPAAFTNALTSPGSHDSRSTYMTGSNLHSTTPCSKGSHMYELDSPSRRSISGLSPAAHLTPLPRLTLTPRSADSRRQQNSELPIFPMDLDTDTKATTTSDSSGLATPPSIIRQDDKRRGSFFPMPEWDKSDKEPESIVQNLFPGRSASLLHPQHVRTSDPFELIIDSHERTHLGGDDYDNDSLSASDDEDDFFLAAPCVIQEERKSSYQASKLRKLDSFTADAAMPPRRLPSGQSLRSGLASNASLLGMDFVTSSTNLQNMDRSIGSRVFSVASLDELTSIQQQQQRSASDGASLSMANGSHVLQNDQRLRDMTMTPPAIRAEPGSPPPLHQGNSSTRHMTESSDNDYRMHL